MSTFYIVTEGNEDPDVVLCDYVHTGKRTWKGPHTAPHLARAATRDHLRGNAATTPLHLHTCTPNFQQDPKPADALGA